MFVEVDPDAQMLKPQYAVLGVDIHCRNAGSRNAGISGPACVLEARSCQACFHKSLLSAQNLRLLHAADCHTGAQSVGLDRPVLPPPRHS